MDYLRNQPDWDQTVVVVTSDHGEEFKEHGRTSHSRTCYIESVRVPLLLRIPGIEPQEVAAPVGLIDIAPTLLNLVSPAAHKVAKEFDGQSLLLPALSPEDAWQDRPLFCSLMTGSADDFTQRAVRRGTYSLVTDADTEQVQLFDLEKDPKEQRSVASDLPKVVKELQHLMKQQGPRD